VKTEPMQSALGPLRDDGMRYYDSALDVVGSTPLVRLRRVTACSRKPRKIPGPRSRSPMVSNNGTTGSTHARPSRSCRVKPASRASRSLAR